MRSPSSLRAEEQEHGLRVTTVTRRTATPMLERVHEQEGQGVLDASARIDRPTVVDAILHVLDLPDDATVSDLTIRPR